MTMRTTTPEPALTDTNQPLLSVQNLCIDLEGPVPQPGLVKNLSFDLPRGSSLALIGESGCGKTLTSMALQRLLPRSLRISSGSILFGGHDLATASQRHLHGVRGRSIGTVFQEPMSSLNPTMTVGDQIGESRRLHLGESRRTARTAAAQLLDRVGIPNAAHRVRAYPHELSGGMQQRAMIAAAIACDPQLLIADEPTTALDVTIQAEILDLLRALRDDMDLAVLLVTHDLGVVADFCEQIVVMYAGQSVEHSSVRSTLTHPQHPYTQALVASTPYNAPPRSRLVSIEGRVPAAGSFPEGCRFAQRCPHAAAECLQPQEGHAVEPGHLTWCGRVARGEISLPAVGRG